MTKVKGETILSLTIAHETEGIKTLPALAKEVELNSGKTIADFLQVSLGGAINLNASDIHLEPEKDRTKLRVRIDGILHDVIDLQPKIAAALLSRIKLLSGVKLNITDRPQDGRFSVIISDQDTPIEIRVSVIPAEYGESIVARILNPKNIISMEELGLRDDLLNKFNQEIRKPNGMIIVTGPTGSGKTTTLYAFLKALENPEIKIITIEDPIEYHLKGVSQTQVSKNYDFANGLKSIVRQDPDVILVGEIRDAETCDIALQAALTGHLVFSTLHTNDAAGTIARLLALGAKPYNIGPAINMAIAQRLLRKVCQNCFSWKIASAQELETLQKELASLPGKIKIPPLKAGLKIPKINGCEECHNTGYKGRIGLFEALIIDSEMEGFLLQAPSIAQVRDFAIKKGMVTMHQDGFIKVLRGMTTIEEVERVTAEKD